MSDCILCKRGHECQGSGRHGFGVKGLGMLDITCPITEEELDTMIKNLRGYLNDTMKRESEEPFRGWAWPSNSRKAHYFVNGRSLCGRWGFLGQNGDSNQGTGSKVGPDDCVACWRKATKL